MKPLQHGNGPSAQPYRGWLMNLGLLVGVGLLNHCASPQPVTLPAGTHWRDVAKVAGQPTATFSYRINGRKVDLVTFDKASSPVVFEDSRLVAVVAPTAMAEWDRRVTQCLQPGRMPFEAGVGPLHSWVTGQRQRRQPLAAAGHLDAGDVAEAAAAAVILAPISPILLSAGVVGASEHAMTGKNRRRAQTVNEALLNAGVSYRGFLNQFTKPDLEISKGSYRVSEYYATPGALFTGLDFYYDVGIQNGNVQWVAYEAAPVRHHTYLYWKAHCPP
ncbi:MAG: hypothetical protein NTV46_07865 [Verrucomicrobia bacterium]|nr:hypothetical protein [Verrucomicrobiota bacterium]